MAWVEADRDAIKAAIASGELDVQYNDRRVRYRSIDELRSALAMISNELDKPALVADSVPNQIRMVEKTKGW